MKAAGDRLGQSDGQTCPVETREQEDTDEPNAADLRGNDKWRDKRTE